MRVVAEGVRDIFGRIILVASQHIAGFIQSLAHPQSNCHITSTFAMLYPQTQQQSQCHNCHSTALKHPSLLYIHHFLTSTPQQSQQTTTSQFTCHAASTITSTSQSPKILATAFEVASAMSRSEVCNSKCALITMQHHMASPDTPLDCGHWVFSACSHLERKA